jgi:hypothetical protein
LKRKHGANLTAVKNVEKKGLDDVVLMVPEGDLITFEPVGQLKKFFPPLPGTEKTGVLSILGAIGSLSNVCEFNMIGQTFFFKIVPQDASSSRIKPQIDVDGEQLITDRNSLQTLFQEMK